MHPEVYINSVINNMIQTLSLAADFSDHPNATVEEVPGAVRIFNGSDYAFFNGVFNNHPYNKDLISQNIIASQEFFATKNKSFVWWWLDQQEIPNTIQAELAAHQYQFVGEMLGIAVNLKELKQNAATTNCEIRTVSTQAEYDSFIDIICVAFELNDKMKKDMQAIYRSFGDDGHFQHYLAYDAGKPSAALTTYRNGRVAGIYNCATLPTAQKKGLCSSLAQCALQDAIKANCHYAVAQLMPSAMARGLFEKMGFKTYCRFLPFLKQQ